MNVAGLSEVTFDKAIYENGQVCDPLTSFDDKVGQRLGEFCVSSMLIDLGVSSSRWASVIRPRIDSM